MRYTLLPQRELLSFSGADTEPFLQGLISNDLKKLKPGEAMYAAMLSPQGKFLHDFFLMRRDATILLDCDTGRLPDLLQRLQIYKLRADVVINRLEKEGVIAAWEGDSLPEPPPPLLAAKDPRLPALGFRIMGDAAAAQAWCNMQGWQEATAAAYDAMRLALGVPDGAQDMIIDRSFLLELGFEALHGVDFNKGCYVGQEVTARSKFRGQVRKHLYQVTAKGELPPLGTAVTQGEATVGELRSHQGHRGLAILRIEAVEKASKDNVPLIAGDTAIEAALPAWVKSTMAA